MWLCVCVCMRAYVFVVCPEKWEGIHSSVNRMCLGGRITDAFNHLSYTYPHFPNFLQ